MDRVLDGGRDKLGYQWVQAFVIVVLTNVVTERRVAVSLYTQPVPGCRVFVAKRLRQAPGQKRFSGVTLANHEYYTHVTNNDGFFYLSQIKMSCGSGPQQVEVWQAKPLLIEDHYARVFAPGAIGMIWNQNWTFDRVDDGACRIKFHSDYDGMLLQIALGNDFDGGIHPYVIFLNGQGGPSYITHNNCVISRIEQTPPLVHGKPTWMWMRFLHGKVWVGYGETVGENIVMGGKTPNPLGGMYRRFGVGKTGNSGAFELLDVQPMERRRRTIWN